MSRRRRRHLTGAGLPIRNGLKFWINAKRLQGVVAPGAAIPAASLPELSGSGAVISFADATRNPIYNEPGGFPAIEMLNASAQALCRMDVNGLDLSPALFTIIIVWKAKSVADQNIFSFKDQVVTFLQGSSGSRLNLRAPNNNAIGAMPYSTAGRNITIIRADNTNALSGGVEIWHNGRRFFRHQTPNASLWTTLANVPTMYFGTRPDGTNVANFNGYYYEILGYDRALSDAEIESSQANYAAPGWGNIALTVPTDHLYVHGQSIANGSNTDGQWEVIQAAGNLPATVRLSIYAEGGKDTAYLALNAAQIDALYDAKYRHNILYFNEGVNDLNHNHGSVTGADEYTRIVAYLADRKTAHSGVITVLGSSMPVNITPASTYPGYEADRLALNIRERGGVGTAFNFLADMGGDTGILSDATNVTYFSDGIHPTPVAYTYMDSTYLLPAFTAALAL